jgi:dTDP-4-dehydrorhamnose 3,5-epimerase
MKFRETALSGAYEVEIESSVDERGFFARIWCAREFERQGLPAVVAQTSISRSEVKGTVRGMHMQLPPSREAKLVRCIRGAIHDVIIDMRQTRVLSQSYAVNLMPGSTMPRTYRPVAHGFGQSRTRLKCCIR